jgi:Molecular chaperone, HSP90 family
MSAQQVTATGLMRINLPGVIKMLGESLYSDPSVAIRELIQNANDTCIVRQAKDPKCAPAGNQN